MKVVGIDNFDREQIGDILICENLTEQRANFIVLALNVKYCRHEDSPTYYKAVPDNYKLRNYTP